MRSHSFALPLSVCIVLFAAGCQVRHPFVWVEQLPTTEVPVDTLPLRVGDRIAVSVSRMEEMRAGVSVEVGADGNVMLPLVGPFQLLGLTPEAAARKLNARLSGIVVNPDAQIAVVSPRTPAISVVGEVNEPGPVEVAQGSGVLSALADAGGLTEFANPNGIYVVRKYPKLARIRFRYSDLTGGVAKALSFELRDGDVIVVE